MKNSVRNYLFVLLLMLTGACTEKKQTISSDSAVVVRTRPVEILDYAAPISYSGILATLSETKLSFKIGGIISKIYVKEGDHVQKGQVLATLDLTEINAQVQQAAQGVEKSDRDYNRVKGLYEDTVATLEQYQNVQTQQHIEKENLRIARFNQQYAQIRATDDGVIVKKIMNEGELADPGSAVLLVNGTSGNDWVVRVGVSDKDWVLLRKSDIAEVNIEAYPSETFKGYISKIAEAADPASGTYEIEVKILPEGKKFASGLFSNVQIKTNAAQKITMIPIEALAEADSKTGYVYVLNDDKTSVTKKKVQIAFIDGGKVAIKNGLENLSNVITDGASYLTENVKVKEVK